MWRRTDVNLKLNRLVLALALAFPAILLDVAGAGRLGVHEGAIGRQRHGSKGGGLRRRGSWRHAVAASGTLLPQQHDTWQRGRRVGRAGRRGRLVHARLG